MKKIIKQISVSKTPLYRNVEKSSSLISECIFGEEFIVYEQTKNWSFGCLKQDNYKGWTPSKNLGINLNNDYIVSTNSSTILTQPDIKSKLIEIIPIGSRVKVIDKFNNWFKIQIPNRTNKNYGYCPSIHLIKIKQNQNWKLLKLIMKQMIGTPYLWGGRTNFGIDCSGLLQMLFNFAGISIPRDTHQQVTFFKNSKLFELININRNFDYNKDITKGDIIFWKGHVGIMFNQKFLLHANAFHMGVFIEPLKNTINRHARQNLMISNIFRYFE